MLNHAFSRISGLCIVILFFAAYPALAQNNTSGGSGPLFMNKSMNTGASQKTSPFLFNAPKKKINPKDYDEQARQANERMSKSMDEIASKRHEKLAKDIESRRQQLEAINKRPQATPEGKTVNAAVPPAAAQQDVQPIVRYEPDDQKKSSRPPRLFNMPE